MEALLDTKGLFNEVISEEEPIRNELDAEQYEILMNERRRI